jgi:hypothetical protein
MARIRCTTRKSVIPLLPSRLAERPLHRTVMGQSSHLERLHRRLHEEQEHRHKEQEQHDSSPSPQQEVESGRQPSPTHQSEMPPTPPQGIPTAGGHLDKDDDDDDYGGSSSRSTELSEEQEPKNGSLDPSLVTPLTGVTSTMLSTPCCVRPSTVTLGLLCTLV